MHKPRPLEFSPVKLLIILVGSVVVAEVGAHLLISYLPNLPYLLVALIDSLITAGLTFPMLLLFAFKPLAREMARRQESERALEESQALYQSIIEDQAEMIFRMDKFGKITYVNEAGARFWGRQSSELLGVDFNSVITQPHDPDHLEPNLLKPVVSAEKRIFLPGGAVRWVAWTVRAIIGAGGLVSSYQAVGRDVTENHRILEELRLARTHLEENVQLRTAELDKMNAALRKEISARLQVEETLRERESALELIIDQSMAISWTTDLNLNITSMQGSILQTLGINPAWRYGEPITDVFEPADRATILNAHRRALKGETSKYELRIKDRVFENHIRPYYNRSRELAGCIGTGIDITSLREAESTIRMQTDALKAMAGRPADQQKQSG